MSNPYNVKITEITFSKTVKEPDAKALFDNILTGGPDGQVRELTDYSRTKIVYLTLHISYEYDSLVGDRLAGSAVWNDEELKIITITYDSNDLVTNVVRGNLPTVDRVKEIAQRVAEMRVDSYVKEFDSNIYVNEVVNSYSLNDYSS